MWNQCSSETDRPGQFLLGKHFHVLLVLLFTLVCFVKINVVIIREGSQPEPRGQLPGLVTMSHVTCTHCHVSDLSQKLVSDVMQPESEVF